MKKLTSLRKKIELIDKKISGLLQKRFKIVREIGSLKEKNKLEIQQKSREEELLKLLKEYCKNDKKCEIYIKNIFTNIYKESREIQKK